jgi:hypothetical protein
MSERNAASTEDSAPPNAEARRESAGGAPDAFVQGVSEVIAASLGVAASVARVVAQSTARGGTVPPGPPDRPLEALIHYGVATVTNVLGMVATGVEGAGRAARGVKQRGEEANGARPAARSPSSEFPTVDRGATLRVPLSIENPGTEPMRGLLVRCSEVRHGQLGAGRALDKRNIRFAPDRLDIAARDFEKLTVFVETEPDTAAGAYEVVIALGSDDFNTVLHFSVVEPKVG